MALKYNFIGEITPMKETWKIKTRIIRVWKSPSFDKPNEDNSIEMVLLDEKGDKIQATVKKSLIRKFSNQITEGQLRVITNFGVGQSSGNYRPTQHPYKINFFFSTSVRVCEDLSIPLYGFKFVSFDDILSNRMDDKFLIDTIGEVVAISSIEKIAGKESKRLIIEMNDIEKRNLKCTLWDQFAEQALSYVADGNRPIILIIQSAKIKEWKGEITLSNSLYSTQLFFNVDVDDVNEFKNRLNKEIENTSIQWLTQSSTRTSNSITDEFLQLNHKKSLDEIRETDKATYCITLATIVCIRSEYSWFYLACKKCNKKVTKEDDNNFEHDDDKKVEADKKITKEKTFYCRKCKSSVKVESVVPRFKVEVRVVDESGSASFVMFDREVVAFLHKSAYDLRESLTEIGEVDSFPEELNEFVGKIFLFKVEVSDYNLKQKWPIYTVMKMSDNEDLIKSFLGSSNVLQDTVSDDTQRSMLVNETEKKSISYMGDNEHLSASSPCTSPSIKRLLEAESDDTRIEMSTTKKKKVVVNIEKDEK